MSSGSICQVNEGAHDFEERVVETVPPTPEQLEATDVSSYTDSSSVVDIVESLTAKRIVIICKDCGMVAAGAQGDAGPKVP